jgi:hypothetical protein
MKWWDAYEAEKRHSVRGIAVADTIAVIPRTVAGATTVDVVGVTLKEV